MKSFERVYIRMPNRFIWRIENLIEIGECYLCMFGLLFIISINGGGFSITSGIN